VKALICAQVHQPVDRHRPRLPARAYPSPLRFTMCGPTRLGSPCGVQKAVYIAVAIPVARLINEQDVRRSRLVVDAMTSNEGLEGVRIEIERWN